MGDDVTVAVAATVLLFPTDIDKCLLLGSGGHALRNGSGSFASQTGRMCVTGIAAAAVKFSTHKQDLLSGSHSLYNPFTWAACMMRVIVAFLENR